MKPNSRNKGNWKILMTVFLVILAAGSLAAWFIFLGQTNFLANPWELFEQVRPFLLILSLLCFILATVLLLNAKKNNQVYLHDDGDEQIFLFQMANRQYQQAMFINVVAQILLIFNIVAGFRLMIDKSSAVLFIPIMEIIFLVVIGLQQGYASTVYRKIRQTEFPLFPSPSQVKGNIYQFDEGELQAHQSEAYQTLLNLTYYVLPALFVMLGVLSYLTGQVQLVALTMLLLIYLYTSWRLYWVVGRYYR